jgi:uncharacterized membrane protein YeaQ/YmgE (transglycosylase-associated protein family)
MACGPSMEGEFEMIGAILLGFVAGVIARVLMPRDFFRKMSGPASWGVSLGAGLLGALVGYVIFTLGLGIGDTDIFDWGGVLSAVIGTLIVLGILGWFLRRRAASQPVEGSTPAPLQQTAAPPTSAPPASAPLTSPPAAAPPTSAPPASAPPTSPPAAAPPTSAPPTSAPPTSAPPTSPPPATPPPATPPSAPPPPSGP